MSGRHTWVTSEISTQGRNTWVIRATSQLVLQTSQLVLDTPGQLKRHNSSRWGFPGDSV